MENTLLNLIPAAYLPEVHISQYDVGRTLTFNLKEGASDYNVPTGATVTVKATKPSGFGFAVPCTFSGGVVTLVVTETMTPEHGRFPAELSIVSGNTTIGTSNFIFNIERSPHPEGTIDGDAETIIPELTLLVERIEAAAEDVDEKAELFLNLSAEAETLPAGSPATANYSNGVLTLGIPRGYDGDDTKADAIVKSASGEVASFSDGGNGLLVKSLNVNIVPKQSGSGDASPSNVRPISGYTDVNVNVCGVNAWDEEWELGRFDTTTGANASSSNQIRSKNYIPIKPNTRYYFKTPYNAWVIFFNENRESIANGQPSDFQKDGKSFACGGYGNIYLDRFTTPSEARYMRFYLVSNYGTTYNNDISINYPATDTSYHIGANNESYPISLGQTVYGGTRDVVSGKLTIDKGYVTLNEINCGNIYAFGGTNGVKIDNILPSAMTRASGICSHCGRVGEYYSSGSMWLGVGSRHIYWLGILDILGLSTFDEFKQWALSQNVQIVYELATPTEITLTPTQVTTLLGNNNIFADSGSVEVEYRADTTLAYNELLSLIASL